MAACQKPVGTHRTGEWENARSSPIAPTVISLPATVTVSPSPTSREGAATASSESVWPPGSSVPLGSDRMATAASSPLPLVMSIWLAPSGVSPSRASTREVVNEMSSGSWKTTDFGSSASSADVFCLPKPAVRPVSTTTSSVISATVPAISPKRPLADVISLIPTNMV